MVVKGVYRSIPNAPMERHQIDCIILQDLVTFINFNNVDLNYLILNNILVIFIIFNIILLIFISFNSIVTLC